MIFLFIVVKLICDYRRQKNATRYPYLRPPNNNDKLWHINSLFGLTESCINVLDFWFIFFAAVETLKTITGKLGWIRNDMKGIWFYILSSVAHSLIWQFAIMYVNAPTANVARVSLQHFLCFIPTFQGGFQDITRNHKSQILKNKNPLDLNQIGLEVHIYKTDKDFTLLPHDKIAENSSSGTLPPSAHACKVFVDVASKNKVIYQKTAKEKEAKI